jgi:hypothetical protein
LDVLDQILLIVSAVAAVVAAIFAFRADIFTRSGSRQAAAQREADVQPRILVHWRGGGAVVSFSNTGGAAISFVWVGMHDDAVFATYGGIPQHAASLTTVPIQLGQAIYKTGIATMLCIAEDVQGRWWDCRTGHRLAPSDPKLYLTKRMDQVGIAQLTELLLGLALKPPLPTDYV